ncbi:MULTISPECIES: hypothetical protein [Mycolicibacterium]|jgi:hypothetical protein|uniref:Uncharacterized protein n=1 Tax=Mycolicibacterium phocaicum TaxID=319706 RepID=A0A7I7ZMC3_9MYCO|nr:MULTISPECIES: hypothetical protein [Mycolicibacterium]TLH67195.1 hypothetical protein C1S79_15240 [Mycolicibacterium phocaicum]BBZ55365.1 hypothetical protein MPHO_23570 [Mycolicibacterium phocaicum]
MSRTKNSEANNKWAIGVIAGSVVVGVTTVVLVGAQAQSLQTTSANGTSVSSVVSATTVGPIISAAPAITGPAPLYPGQDPG